MTLYDIFITKFSEISILTKQYTMFIMLKKENNLRAKTNLCPYFKIVTYGLVNLRVSSFTVFYMSVAFLNIAITSAHQLYNALPILGQCKYTVGKVGSVMSSKNFEWMAYASVIIIINRKKKVINEICKFIWSQIIVCYMKGFFRFPVS